jgi:RimJ/RimL family protein N-acetyltransferase
VVRVEPATVAWLEALVEGDAVFATRFGIPVVPGWAGFPEALPRLLATARAGGPTVWSTPLFFDDDGHSSASAVGRANRTALPELGYAVAPDRQGRGLATAAIRQLVARAEAAGLRLVLAHTLPHESASTSVLRRCGFVRALPPDPEPGAVWRWELRLAAQPSPTS